MTVDTPSWMASTSKMISGTCIMMLVDQGVISLDDPVETYLPALKTNPSKTPFTFRNLYTHTDGFEGHWGAWMNDMEERIALKVPYYEVGTFYRYNGTGMDLACKALEAVSGETLPDFYLHHLLKPLGCTDTFIGNACSDGRSTPLDMAKIGQMLLQKGAYGEKRFFSEKTFEQMLPRNLEYILGKKTPVEYGIGTTYFSDEGLGEGTFAHGAASAAATRIDAENDLVISMTRNAAGKNFGKYHPRFINTIIEGMVKE
jgi:CubicO group peptidase (beta-lactamase class C family)